VVSVYMCLAIVVQTGMARAGRRVQGKGVMQGTRRVVGGRPSYWHNASAACKLVLPAQRSVSAEKFTLVGSLPCAKPYPSRLLLNACI
jgi:hypothetical protein